MPKSIKGLICKKCNEPCVILGAAIYSYWKCPDDTGGGDGTTDWKPFYGKVVE